MCVCVNRQMSLHAGITRQMTHYSNFAKFLYFFSRITSLFWRYVSLGMNRNVMKLFYFCCLNVNIDIVTTYLHLTVNFPSSVVFS